MEAFTIIVLVVVLGFGFYAIGDFFLRAVRSVATPKTKTTTHSTTTLFLGDSPKFAVKDLRQIPPLPSRETEDALVDAIQQRREAEAAVARASQLVLELAQRLVTGE